MAEDRTYRNQIGIGSRGAYSRFLREKGFADDEAGALAFLKSSGQPFTSAESAAARRQAVQEGMAAQGVGTAAGARAQALRARGSGNADVRRVGTAADLNTASFFDQQAMTAPGAPAGIPAAGDLASLYEAASRFQQGGQLGPEGRPLDLQAFILQQLAGGGR